MQISMRRRPKHWEIDKLTPIQKKIIGRKFRRRAKAELKKGN